jgi:hypothetical protein
MNKPDGQTVILYRAVPALMAGLPLRKIRNFGGKVGEFLEGLGCITAQDVQHLDMQMLEVKCGDAKQAECVSNLRQPILERFRCGHSQLYEHMSREAVLFLCCRGSHMLATILWVAKNCLCHW